MEIKSVENIEGQYQLVFKDEMDGNLVETSIHFFVDWKLKFKFLIGAKPVPVPYDFKKILASIPIHIPKHNKQILFKFCMNYLIQETDMPAQIETVPHPGYPLIVVTFNPKIIEAEKMEKILERILDAIELTKPTIIEVPKEEPEVEEDPLDEIDEDNIFEYEFDDELKEFGAKEPVIYVTEDAEDSEPIYFAVEEEEND